MKKTHRKKRHKRVGSKSSGHERALGRLARELYEAKVDADEVMSQELEKAAAAKRKRLRPSGTAPRSKAAAEDAGAELHEGLVVALASGACRVESGGRLVRCVLPSRLALDQRSAVAVGDEVVFVAHGRDYRLEEVRPRRTVLSRPDPQNPRLERVIAANVEIVSIIVSMRRPQLRPALVDRYLIAVERGGAEPLLVANKIDLIAPEDQDEELAVLSPYRDMGIRLHACSALTGQGIEALGEILAGRTAVFVGHSGVGKSSILNALSPKAKAETAEVSPHHARGRHTTTRSRLYRLDRDIRLIDTPGIRELGLWRLGPDELRLYFPELAEVAVGCKFNDCSHVHEPECAVRDAVEEGRLPAMRYTTYRRILESLDAEEAGR